jgi:hypothetical protein
MVSIGLPGLAGAARIFMSFQASTWSSPSPRATMNSSQRPILLGIRPSTSCCGRRWNVDPMLPPA